MTFMAQFNSFTKKNHEMDSSLYFLHKEKRKNLRGL